LEFLPTGVIISSKTPRLTEIQEVEKVETNDKTFNILDRIQDNFLLTYRSSSLPTFFSTLISREKLERGHSKIPGNPINKDILSDRDIAYYKLRKSWFDNRPDILETLLEEKRTNLYNWRESYDRKQLHIPTASLETRLIDKIGKNFILDKTYTTESNDYYLVDGIKQYVPRDSQRHFFV